MTKKKLTGEQKRARGKALNFLYKQMVAKYGEACAYDKIIKELEDPRKLEIINALFG